MLTDLLLFSNVQQYRSKMKVFEWFNLQRNSSGKKKLKELQCS